MKRKITLACTDCLSRNYSTYKNVYTTSDRLSLRKYCKRCKKHTLHRETK